jgi:hypothetical protein
MGEKVAINHEKPTKAESENELIHTKDLKKALQSDIILTDHFKRRLVDEC